jgi:L-2-hydroxyglutarate oxidase LhgO
MEIFEVDCLVIGAGVIGLAVARELAMRGYEVLVVEKESSFGMQTSSRNSEVIHAGIYYPKGSLKAQLCVRGRELLYAYCEKNQIPYKRCGKLIVASSAGQEVKLRQIQAHAISNGVDDITWLTKNALLKKEPALNAHAALYSPSTGVVDSHAYMLQLLADIERYGGQCVFNSKVSMDKVRANGIELILNDSEAKVVSKYCVNAAGLSAISLLSGLDQFQGELLPEAHFAKGSYFSYACKVPFSHLIYPMPEDGGLGVHLTLDLQGNARFGPDVEWLDSQSPKKVSSRTAEKGRLAEPEFDYQVDESKKNAFNFAISSYWCDVDVTKLVADYAGIRPKVAGPGQAPADFIIQNESQHGIKGLVNLFGIESPGLTSSLAIAEKVAALLFDVD